MTFGSVTGFANRKGPRQFVKFCIVGATSTVIDFSVLNLLHFRFGWPLIWSITCAFLLAVTNGFYWNRRWTFRAGEGDPKRQYPKFLATNIIGYLLNISIMTLALYLGSRLGYIRVEASLARIIELMALGKGNEIFTQLSVNTAKALATVVVTAWNFTASRLWTFKQGTV